MGAVCACAEERTRVKALNPLFNQDVDEKEDIKIETETEQCPTETLPTPSTKSRSNSELIVEPDLSQYGSIGKYQIDRKSGKWRAGGRGVFLGHLTEGKVSTNAEEGNLMQLCDFGARVAVRFSMPDKVVQRPGEISLIIDCFTAQSLHSADVFLNGEKIISRIEVQDEIFGK